MKSKKRLNISNDVKIDITLMSGEVKQPAILEQDQLIWSQICRSIYAMCFVPDWMLLIGPMNR